MQENASFSKIKLRLFSHFSVILTIVKNEWLATNSQNAILNNFEEYYTCIITMYLYENLYITMLSYRHDVRILDMLRRGTLEVLVPSFQSCYLYHVYISIYVLKRLNKICLNQHSGYVMVELAAAGDMSKKYYRLVDQELSL